MSDPVYSFLVPPGRNRPQPPVVRGTEIPRSGRLFQMLDEIYSKADVQCNIPVRFVIPSDGSQQNEFRSLMIQYLQSPTFEHGMIIAERLRDATAGKSGLGLLFLISGKESANMRKIVLSRFPADVGVVAETTGPKLSVSFVEKVFMKNAHAYKAAFYEDKALKTGFWTGLAIDKQFNNASDPLADYWIRRFLISDFKTTSKAGTKRLAVAMKRALQTVKAPSSKETIVASAVLSRSIAGRTTSVNSFMDQFGLDEESRKAVLQALPSEALADDKFVFDRGEFELQVPLRSIELDNGGVLTAPSEKFDDCFVRETIAGDKDRTKFTTIGRIVGQELGGKKR